MKETSITVWTRSALARKAGVGPDTLRFYEEKGLLGKPDRNSSGYRIYSREDLDRVRFIQRAQELGFSLKDIKELLRLTGSIKTNRGQIRNFAQARLEVIRAKICDLQAMERALGSLVEQCDGEGKLQGCPIVEFTAGKSSTLKSKGNCHE